jgi:pantoate--beta-alanine ligase
MDLPARRNGENHGCLRGAANELEARRRLAHRCCVQWVTSVAAMQRLARRWRQRGGRIGFVPTMGYLHEGHVTLIRRARQAVGRGGRVVVSIYVNLTQFGPREDLKKYPRDLKRDKQLCRTAGVDAVFVPVDAEMYPAGEAEGFSTWVSEERLSRAMEGRSRPTHFRGVTTVVAKLFNIVLPDMAVFGAKDWQQAAVVRRMTRDLNFPIKIIVAPTHREPDGLAMSSRNKYLVGDLRGQAVVLWQTICKAQATVRAAERLVESARLKAELKRFIEQQPDARVDYVEFFHPETLQTVTKVGRGAHLALAVFVGKTRLIDNARL